MGAEYFESNRDFDNLRDPDIPLCFLFVFNCFLEINSCSGESITWTDIKNYAIMRNIDFTQYELDIILKCKAWAGNKINAMREEADTERHKCQQN